jgi:hypothetical protein
MSDQESEISKISNANSSQYKYTLNCCCISDKWCFQHTGLAGVKEYDDIANNFCICLDCCTWCLEFKTTKISCICKKNTICYLCCCSIYFVE